MKSKVACSSGTRRIGPSPSARRVRRQRARKDDPQVGGDRPSRRPSLPSEPGPLRLSGGAVGDSWTGRTCSEDEETVEPAASRRSRARPAGTARPGQGGRGVLLPSQTRPRPHHELIREWPCGHEGPKVRRIGGGAVGCSRVTGVGAEPLPAQLALLADPLGTGRDVARTGRSSRSDRSSRPRRRSRCGREEEEHEPQETPRAGRCRFDVVGGRVPGAEKAITGPG